MLFRSSAQVLTADTAISTQTMELFWSLLRATHGSKLLRLKGLVHTREHPDEPLLLHAAQQVMHPAVILPAWPTNDRTTRIVLITRDLDREHVERLWEAFVGQD